MRSAWFSYLISVCLLVMYINRGLFVAMPEIEISCAHPAASKEINSLLEIIINWAGGHNELDEDGDTPESYNIAKTIQPLSDHNLTYACLKCPFASARKIFFQIDEAVNSSDYYGTIDQPPKQVKFEVSCYCW